MDSATEAPLFRFQNVSVLANGVPILIEVDLELPQEGISVVVGPSGAGKTTLLRLCNRLSVPTAGQIYYRGTPLVEIDPLELRRRVGMVFQKPVLFGGTVRGNLQVADPGADEQVLVDAMTTVHLPVGLLDRPADDLSGGEAQRVCLARTLLTGPETLLMDEPTASVDPALQRGLEREVIGLSERGAAVVWVTHDNDQMKRLATYTVAMDSGRIRYSGPASGFLVAEHSELRD